MRYDLRAMCNTLHIGGENIPYPTDTKGFPIWNRTCNILSVLPPEVRCPEETVRRLLSRLLPLIVALAGFAKADTVVMTFEGPSSPIGLFEWDENGISLFDTPNVIITPSNACAFGGCVTNGTNVAAEHSTATLFTTFGGTLGLNGFDASQTFVEFEPGVSASDLFVTGYFHGG